MTDHKIAAIKFHVEGENGVTYGAIAIDNNGPITPDDVKKVFEQVRNERISSKHSETFEFKVVPNIPMSPKDCEKEDLPYAHSVDKIKELIKSKAESLRKLKP